MLEKTLSYTRSFFIYFMLETICQLLIIIVIKNQFNIKIPKSGRFLFFIRMKMSVFMKQCENLNNFVSS